MCPEKITIHRKFICLSFTNEDLPLIISFLKIYGTTDSPPLKIWKFNFETKYKYVEEKK